MSTDSARLVNIIRKNKGAAADASEILTSVPKMVTILSKMQVDTNRKTPVTDLDKMRINREELDKIQKRMKTVSENNENIIKLFPDIELSIRMSVAGILSPKNMIGTFLNYRMETPIASAGATASILEKIKNHITKRYKLEAKLPDMIREAMYEKGAYVLAIIPESSVDEVINGDITAGKISTEGYRKAVSSMLEPKGLIGEVSFESALGSRYNTETLRDMKTILDDQSFSIIDNYDVLKFPKLRTAYRNKIVRDTIRGRRSASSNVSLEDLSYNEIFRASRANKPDGGLTLVKTKTETKRISLGSPMTVKLNSRAVIPIFKPGAPDEHLLYVVLIDPATGYPINDDMAANENNPINGGNSGQFNNNNNQNSLTQKAVNNLMGDSADTGIQAVYEIYKDVVERQLYDTVRKGVYGHDIEISNKNDIYFMMWSRALANQKTSMLLVPADLVTYMTYDYNKNGTGRSILEGLSVLMSMRAIMLMSKIVAFAKKAIDVTNVNITFDPNDPDPEKTMEEIMDSVIKMRQNFFPLGINNPTDLVDWNARAGVKFSYENHPGMPNVKIDFTPDTLDHEIPSDDIEEVIRKQCIMAMGNSPEQVDNAFSPEFATTVSFNNVLTTQRTIVDQVKTEVFIVKIVHDIIVNDEELRDIIRIAIKEHIGDIEKHLTTEEQQLYTSDPQAFFDDIIDRIATNIRVELPRPGNMNLENTSQEFDKYKDNMAKAMDSIVSTEFMTEDTCGDLSEHIDTIKNVFLHAKLREWMSENNFMPEAFDLIRQTNETEDKLDLNKTMTDHIKSLMLSSSDLFDKLKQSREATSVDVVRVGIGELEGGSASSSSSSDSSSGSDEPSGEGGGEDDGMGDEFADIGGDLGGDLGGEGGQEVPAE